MYVHTAAAFVVESTYSSADVRISLFVFETFGRPAHGGKTQTRSIVFLCILLTLRTRFYRAKTIRQTCWPAQAVENFCVIHDRYGKHVVNGLESQAYGGRTRMRSISPVYINARPKDDDDDRRKTLCARSRHSLEIQSIQLYQTSAFFILGRTPIFSHFSRVFYFVSVLYITA